MPAVVGDDQRVLVHPDPVAGVALPLAGTAAVRGGGAGVEDDHRRPPLRIELLGAPDVGLVQMAGEDQVDPHRGEQVDRLVSVAQHLLAAEIGRRNHVVVGDDNLEHRLGRLLEDLRHFEETAELDPAVLDGPAEGGVDPHDQHLAVPVDRLELRAEVLLVGAEGVENALPDAVERDVVVAGDHQRRHRNAIDEGAGLAELLRAGALGQVAGEDDHVGAVAVDEVQDPLSHPWQVGGAEVDVGDMEDRTHAAGSRVVSPVSPVTQYRGR
jgi:hypothetical protein